MNYNDPVYVAIVTLIDLKKHASYAEIASVAGVKKQLAINYILRNKHILTIKDGEVTGFISYERNVKRIVEGMFSMGKVYNTSKINYDADQQIIVDQPYYENVKHLISNYCGSGEYAARNIIIHTTENVKAMNDLGFRDFNDVVNEKIEKGEHHVWNDWVVP